METESFQSLVEQFLNTRLPDELAGQISWPQLPVQSRNFILRAFALMKRASFPATDFNPFLLRALSTILPSILPSAGDGCIPPITRPGRHRKLDAYVTSQSWPAFESPPVFLDLGCGFPPVTTMDTARKMPDWRIIGVDRSFARYVVYDRNDHYACFNRQGEFQYFQTQMNASARALNDKPERARNRFKTLFEELYPLLQDPDNQTSTTVSKEGSRLICNHIRDFEAQNLTFIESEIQDLELPPARVIRCMNVLLYFKKEDRMKLLSTIGRLLANDCLVIAGFNHFLGNGARYWIGQKVGDAIAPSEFAFSLDNLRPIGIAPWYTIHDDDPEAAFLADLTGTLRTDNTFWPTFKRRVDDLLDHYAVCWRGKDGFLHFPKAILSPEKLINKMKALWRQIEMEGYPAEAVNALSQAGYQAWINSVGDVAVRPSGAIY